MPYLSLYRKYRSQSFEEIVGQEHITTTLKNALERDRIAHAYLFSGPRGTGKTSTARIMSKCINCESGPAAVPCNTCSVCTAINNDRLFDVVEIDAASNRGIDDVRDLKEKVRVPPAQARKKVYIIDEVHMLTREAFNALLKTLEEPPPHVLFIMATTEPQKLPPTILSRCQRFDFRRLTDAEIAGHINRIAENENFEIEPGACNRIVKTADGSLRDAISILDQLFSFSSGAVTMADADLMFGLVEQQDVFDFMEAIFEGRTADAFDLFQKFFDAGKSFSLFLRLLMEHLRDVYLVRQGLNPPRDTYSEEDRARLDARAKAAPRDVLVALMDEIARVEDRIRWEVYPRIILEILIIKMLDLASGQSAAAPKKTAAKPAPKPEKKQQQPKPAPAQPAAQETAPVPDEPPTHAAQEPPPPEPPEPEPDIEPAEESEEELEVEPEPAPEPLGQDAPFEQVWNAVLADIKKSHLPRYFLFAEAAADLDDDTVVLTYQPEHQFKKEQAQDSECMALLSGALKKRLGREVRIKLRTRRARGEQEPEEQEQAEEQPAPEPAPPQKNLSLFDEVQNVFPNSVEIE